MASPTKLSIEALHHKVNTISRKEILRKRWVAMSLLSIVSLSTQPDAAAAMTQLLLDNILRVKTLNASDAYIGDILQLFQLEDQKVLWKLSSEPLVVPNRLVNNLKDLWTAECNFDSEAACRISVNFMIIACKLAFTTLYPDLVPCRTGTHTSTSPPPLIILPELELTTIINEPGPAKNQVRVSGRADWAFMYGTRGSAVSGTILVVIRAKSRKYFSNAEAKLLAYLAVMRQLRIDSEQGDPAVQGFYTDGERYAFLGITNDGVMKRSRPYEVNVMAEKSGGDLKTVFSFIVSILEIAARSMLSLTLAKGKDRKRVLEVFQEVWVKDYVEPGEDYMYPEVFMEGDPGVEVQEMPPFF